MPYFVNIYKKMAAKLLSIQDVNGYWHASLLDPESYPNPEMSATAFFVFGFAFITLCQRCSAFGCILFNNGLYSRFLGKAKSLHIFGKRFYCLITKHTKNSLKWVDRLSSDLT